MKATCLVLRGTALAGLLFVALGLSGCGNGQQEELSAWMQAERNSIKPDVKPIPEPKRFEPYAYGVSNQLEPFSAERLASVLREGKTGTPGASALVEAEMNRRKQPLEAFPLDAMTMVGSLNRQGRMVALVKINQLLYQVPEGSYLGQNYGRVLRISENAVVLREIVQDPSGEWVERPASLQLQEEDSK